MPKKRNDRERPRARLLVVLTEHRKRLYLATPVLCVCSAASVREAFCPEWLSGLVCGAAFISLCLFLYVLAAVSRKKIENQVSAMISRHALLHELYRDDSRRTFLFVLPGFGLNLIFAGFNGLVGIRSASPWYISFAVYYFLLGLMRFYLLWYEFAGNKRGEAGEEWKLYGRCGMILMMAGIALAGVVILIVLDGRGKSYPGYLIYVVAMYTFWKIISAVINLVKAANMKSPLLKAVRNIGYGDALVSMLSLQTAMFASFHEGSSQFPARMNGLTGAFVCGMVFLAGGGMAVTGRKKQRI